MTGLVSLDQILPWAPSELHIPVLMPPGQGENVAHGLCCRLESAMGGSQEGIQEDLFCLMHTLHNHETSAYKVSWFMLVGPVGERSLCKWSALHRLVGRSVWAVQLAGSVG